MTADHSLNFRASTKWIFMTNTPVSRFGLRREIPGCWGAIVRCRRLCAAGRPCSLLSPPSPVADVLANNS